VVYIQPGQAEGTISIAYGYGRTKGGKVADGVGVNVFPFMKMDGGTRKTSMTTASVSKTGKKYELASTKVITRWKDAISFAKLLLLNGRRSECRQRDA